MAAGALCGVAPFFFRRKIPGFEGKTVPHTNKSNNNASKNIRSVKISPVRKKCEVAGNFLMNTEFKNKISTFRDLLDLPPCIGSASVNELLIWTMKDLFKLHPKVNTNNIPVSEIEGASLHQALKFFCDVLKSLGILWKNTGEWMVNCKYDSSIKLDQIGLEQIALAMLEEMIKLARERLLDAIDDDEDMRVYSPQSSNGFPKSFSDSNSDAKHSLSSSPATPTSVLSNSWKFHNKGERMSYSPPRLLPLRVQAVEKLNPIDLKRLSLHMFHHTVAQDLKYSIQVKVKTDDEQKPELKEKRQSATVGVDEDFEMVDDVEKIDDHISQECETKASCEMLRKEEIDIVLPSLSPEFSELKSNDEVQVEVFLSSPPRLPRNSVEYHIPEPPQLLQPQSNTPDEKQPVPLGPSPPCPPPPPPLPVSPVTSKRKAMLAPSPPSPLPPPALSSVTSPPPPPLPVSPVTSKRKVMLAPPPPPPLPQPASSSVTSKRKAMSIPPPPPPPPVVTSRNKDAFLQSLLELTKANIAPPLPPVVSKNLTSLSPTPPPPPPTLSKIGAQLQPSPPVASKSGSLPPPPPPMASNNGALPPPPPPLMASKNVALPPPPTPPMAQKNGALPPPPSPPLVASKNGAQLLPPAKTGPAPPPPPRLAGGKNLISKKANTKLRRSSQMGSLYRLLKGKVEGSSLNGKSSGRKGKIGAPASGKQGMADALAEMTKRSAYFQQIEEDVKNYCKTIMEVKAAINSFETSDMAELQKFHKYVESNLEKLTDETQVLARFEDFPQKKLEALRMAAALYSKLDSIVSTLRNWPIVPPVGQLLDKAESYFNKIKVEMERLERTKDEESKKFKSHKINFDFSILVQIKELMVDVSSGCMELALKEKRNGSAKENQDAKPEGRKKGSAKMLWKAFQFAFRVYTFAGGHDDRADKLTRELAQEIETDPNQ